MDLQIVAAWPSDDELSEALRRLTQAIDFCGLASGEAGGIFGGSWGYGADYENAVFMMHRYCWCESEMCPWCGGCSDVGYTDPAHVQACYQTRLLALKQRYGQKYRGDYWSVPHDHQQYNAAKKALCEELHRSYEKGNEVHCTCGADLEWMRRLAACECDWHMGRGPFRFGRAVAAPHFWHKASGAQVRWYKYIGRGMEATKPDRGTWADVFRECHESLQADDAVARLADAPAAQADHAREKSDPKAAQD